MAHPSKTSQRAGVPLTIVIVVLAVGVMFGAALMAAFVTQQTPVPAASSTPSVGSKAAVPAEEPAGAKKTFTAPVVSVRADAFVVSLPDMPHKGKEVPTVTVRVTAATTFAARVPKTPQELDQPAGTAAPDTSKGLPPPPARTENDLYKDMPLTLSGLKTGDVVRIETPDAVGTDAITATSVTLILRPSGPAAADAASAPGALPPPTSIDAAPVKTGR